MPAGAHSNATRLASCTDEETRLHRGKRIAKVMQQKWGKAGLARGSKHATSLWACKLSPQEQGESRRRRQSRASLKVSGTGNDPLTHTLIGGTESGPAILSFYTSLSKDPAIPIPVLTQEKWSSRPHTDLYMSSSLVCNSQKLETTQTFAYEYMDKQPVVCSQIHYDSTTERNPV